MIPSIVNICSHSFIGNLINRNSLVLDFGANQGKFAQRITHAFSPQVYLVEPVPELFQKLPIGEKLKKFRCCITGKTGTVRLSMPVDRCATTYAIGTEDNFLEVPSISINDFLDRNNINSIDLLKMDIEGAELDVLRSISRDHLHAIKQMTIEFHDFLFPETRKDIEAIKIDMRAEGFYVISFSFHTNGDILFVRRGLIRFPGYLYVRFLAYLLGFLRSVQRLPSRIVGFFGDSTKSVS